MFKTTIQFIRHSLYPSKQALRLRLAPLHAYMLASLILTLVVTVLDYIVLQPDFFWPMWLFLHGFAIFFFYMGFVAFSAILVQLVTRWLTKRTWPYRQAWPYAVAMTMIPVLFLIVLYHAAPSLTWLGVLMTFIYLTIPLRHIPVKSRASKKPDNAHMR
ncbi:hypothetical protein [Exiguobacterium sp. TNDT2]|uniref:hypothetical protein n=1 Tax=Exiguobacterium sp. TNDT2 TaxID=2233531 RepID=UPI001E5324D0|nr:hypothetical protein [Exiguobacterium sp. TNDT2]